jgi:hypothetical protein
MLGTIYIKKDKLIETLETNMAKHVKEYEEATNHFAVIAAYAADQMVKSAQKLAKKYKERAASIKDGGEVKTAYIPLDQSPLGNLSQPVSHEQEYLDALEMLKFHEIIEEEAKDTIALSQSDFKQFVLDQWSWKQDWTTSNNMYVSGSVGLGLSDPGYIMTFNGSDMKIGQ